MQPILQPKPSWDFRVGVMRADRVEDDKNQDQRIRKVRELKCPIGTSEHRDADEDQQIFQKPIAAIGRTNRERDPENEIDRKRDCEKSVVKQFHVRGSLRVIHATAAIMTSAPNMAESMSFCASHSSP